MQIETRGTLGDKNNWRYNIGSHPSFTGNRTKHDILAFDISDKISAGQNTLIATVEDLNLSAEWVLGMAYTLQVDVTEITPIMDDVKQVFNQTLKGGMVITGNTLQVVGDSNHFSREFLKSDGTLTTNWQENGSMAYLDIPENSVIEFAILEWHGIIKIKENYQPVTFKTPSETLNISPMHEARPSGFTEWVGVKWSDVTEYVKKAGMGNYTVEGVFSEHDANADNTAKVGWSLSVVYSNENMPNRNMVLYAGLKLSRPEVTRSERAVTISGFTVPQVPGKTHFMMVSADGVPNKKAGMSVYSDISMIENTENKYRLGNLTAHSHLEDPGTMPIVPYDNLFNGIIMNTNTESQDYGKIDTRGTLGDKNNSPYNLGSQPSFKGNRARHESFSY